VVADPSATLNAATKQITTSAPADWVGRWRAADSAAGSAIDSVLASTPFPNEPAVARMLSTTLADPSVLWVGSSMPIRDVDAFLGVTERRIRILGNRGANGIDGLVSAALGSAAVSSDPTVVLAGDLSMLHDLTALATAARLEIPITVVVINNDGGGIFHLLPQEGHRHFERHFGTPHGLEFGALARSLGVDAVTAGTEDDLSAALAERPSAPLLVEVHTDRSDNATLHRTLRAAVGDSIRAL
jgi:2-succinyl-5-enolpyruvyl-6-hydroxy-3-cyclohexene-1-carboxylate synthase